jgi:hypothetical protein
MKSKHEFFEKGIANQKRPSIVVDIKLADLSKIANWDNLQKKEALEFLERVKARLGEITVEAREYLRH